MSDIIRKKVFSVNDYLWWWGTSNVEKLVDAKGKSGELLLILDEQS